MEGCRWCSEVGRRPLFPVVLGLSRSSTPRRRAILGGVRKSTRLLLCGDCCCWTLTAREQQQLGQFAGDGDVGNYPPFVLGFELPRFAVRLDGLHDCGLGDRVRRVPTRKDVKTGVVNARPRRPSMLSRIRVFIPAGNWAMLRIPSPAFTLSPGVLGFGRRRDQ